MAPKIGYLLPTREQIMEGKPDAASLLALATRAEAAGFDSVWVGDSLLARPRHDPLTLLAGVAGRVPRIEMGTAVLLPALRNPVVLAHQVATLDQVSEGRLILGVGFAADVANIRAEFAAAGVPFEKRVGRMMEGLRLCRALWTGQPVDWEGRWPVKGGVLAPTPYRAGGPPLWIGGNLPTSLERAGRFFDGWFPVAPAADAFGTGLAQVRSIAKAAGRDPLSVTGAMYMTIAIDENAGAADARLNSFLERYYLQPAAAIRSHQACYAGPLAGVAEYLDGYAKAGAGHLCIRFAGEHETHMAALERVRVSLGW
jgi:alkanesulfonate monooxygenase SsuD/methylene tetrahydromethanopterin reductase-like flavin-dependent oxidoreductase (luciferase family)